MWGRYGRDAGEVRARYGLGIGEVWSRYGRDMGEIWARCARDVGGIWARYGRGADEMWGSLRTGAPVAAAAIPEYKSSTVYELVLRRCASSCPAWWLSRSRSLPLALKKQNNRRHHRRRQETGRRQSPRASAPATQRSAASQEERKRPIESLPQPPTPAPHTQARGPSTPRANAHVAVAATHPTSPAGAVRWRSSLEGERSYLRPPLSRSSARGDPLPCGR